MFYVILRYYVETYRISSRLSFIETNWFVIVLCLPKLRTCLSLSLSLFAIFIFSTCKKLSSKSIIRQLLLITGFCYFEAFIWFQREVKKNFSLRCVVKILQKKHRFFLSPSIFQRIVCIGIFS